MTETKLMRRVGGGHNMRLDGVSDILIRCRGASVMDIGCNRGMVAYEFANNGAAVVHGCDNYEAGIATAREVFTDLRAVRSQFEVVDLTAPPAEALAPFMGENYDIMVVLATFHKLARIMTLEQFDALVSHLGALTKTYFVWRATSFDVPANEAEMQRVGKCLSGFRLVQWSVMSEQLGIAAVWKRG